MECHIDLHNTVIQRRVPRDGRAAKHIGIAVFNGFSLLDTVSIVEAFETANRFAEASRHDAPRYVVRLLSSAGGRIASSSSVFVWTDSVEARGHAHDFHALFIAGGTGVHDAARDGRLLAWLRRTHLRSENVLSIAEGQFLLEAAGFASSAGIGSARGLVPRHYFRRETDPATQREVSSPLESALNLIEADLGTEITCKAAASLAPRASTQFTSVLNRNASGSVSDKIRASAQWLEANGHQPISIDRAAGIAAMSERNFLRRFKAEIGVTPSGYLLYVRLDMSCRLLVETALPVDKIARRCGFGDGGQLARLFRKHMGTTPSEYRNSHRQPHDR
ncbi:helix-turn-helix domain protein [Paraburkholderia xenovorans LB400]|uniref:Transcriptional regulator, AraC family n=1 Tax=Paraburkholderia xenovorans (strain LB400) TaxID=266265 RepID=Q13RU4_PARXL|nr:helix-turn-helix domain-containing protein [Paraburkholderia xenovorans]ABE33195.1 transcriptional regulator, AraC family [Paraburkholderia xenovorans LB400]AIP36000.1 helix-turn-helix domain protein [Paraburkholderia xenovorans LB400]